MCITVIYSPKRSGAQPRPGGRPAKFFIDDPDEGHWDFEFLKDEAGKYAKLRIVNTGIGIDAVGQRIGGQVF